MIDTKKNFAPSWFYLQDQWDSVNPTGCVKARFYFYACKKFILHAEPSKGRSAVFLFASRDSNMSDIALDHWIIKFRGFFYSFLNLHSSFSAFSYCNQGRIKLFNTPRQWKCFRPLFQAVFLTGGYYPPRRSQKPRRPVPRQK